MQKGTIGVTTENIFPIIKKFLYSDHEIFLRELVSNAVDATQKLKSIALSGELKEETGDLTIKISTDSNKKTITVSDSGIGMTEEEIQKYINQIAFSSAGEFLEKYKDQLNNIIGHFGLGFYSSFMVASKVEIETLSWKEGAQPVKWSCEGTPEYKITKGSRKKRGTDVILYLDEESSEYAQDSKIEGLLNKYCKFLPVQIAFGKKKEWKDGKQVETNEDNIINETKPLWTQTPSEIKEEQYLDFYRELYPGQEDPIFNIHLNVDYPFNLTGILYFPKIREKVEVSKNKIQLYCNQVFVTDSVENIVPDFLTLLHGVIDSPDIPLNVSRSYLQSDSNVKKISNHITKKVADRLEEIFKNERKKFESKWDDLKLFIEYGMLSNEKFYERAEKFVLLKNTEGKYFSLEEYKKIIETNQKDKNNKLVYLYSNDIDKQFSYIESAKNKGYDVLLIDSQLGSHFVNLLESKLKDTTFARVDADHIDKLIQKEELSKPEIPFEQRDSIIKAFNSILPEGPVYNIDFENLSKDEHAVLITQSEFMRRYKEMSELGGGMNFYGALPESYNVIINFNHPAVKKLSEETEEVIQTKLKEDYSKLSSLKSELNKLQSSQKDKKEDEIEKAQKERKETLEKEVASKEAEIKNKVADYAKNSNILKQLSDLALLSCGMLKGEKLDKFIKRTLSNI